MHGNTVQILAHMYSRILSFVTGVMIGRINSGGEPLTEHLAELTKEDIERASEDNDKPVTDQMDLFTKTIATSSRSLGHTPEASKLAGKRRFAMLEHMGMRSLFLTVSTFDE